MSKQKESAQLLEQPDAHTRKVNSVTNDTYIVPRRHPKVKLESVLDVLLCTVFLGAFLVAFWLVCAVLDWLSHLCPLGLTLAGLVAMIVFIIYRIKKEK